MSEFPNAFAADTATDTTAATTAPVGRMRLLPSVSFGTRAAALARVALPVALVTAGMVGGGQASAGAENLVTMDTTCCPPAAVVAR